MCVLSALLATLLVTSAMGNARADDDYNSLNFTQIVGGNGYQTEEHKVVTEDGYILTMFRMSSGNCTEPKGTPLLFMHGFLESADCLIDAGPGVGLPYLLADDCFDVWLGNNRGNYYGRAHETLDPDTDNQFWAFSADEMGLYDIPAHIDYVLNATGAEKINYFGYSQGGGIIMITCSEKTQYNDKINVIVAMSPAARVRHTSSPLLKLLLKGVYALRNFLAIAGIDEVFKKGGNVQSLLQFICKQRSIFSLFGLSTKICDGFINLLDPYHPADQISSETLTRIYAHFPAGASVQLISRYTQALKSDYFQKYDYGSKAKNLEKYNSATPPIYNVTKVTAPVVLTYGEIDTIANRTDVEWLKDQLPNVIKFAKVNESSWIHLDNIYNTNLTTLVYPTIKEYLTLYTQK